MNALKESPLKKNCMLESQLLNWNNNELDNLSEWLKVTPQTTTYRVNLLQSTRESFANTIKETGSNKNQSIDTFVIPGIDELLCIAPLQNHVVDLDETKNEVIVDCRCGASLLRGAHIYSPGVLAMLSGTKKGEIVNVFADIEMKCTKGTKIRYESEKKKFIGVGIVRMERYQIYVESPKQPIKGVAVEMLSTISGVPSIGNLSSTKALLQTFPSIVCIKVLDPKPFESILDMCSAPGNKTTYIAELMKDQGILIALDRNESKINQVKKKVKDYGFKCIHAFSFDSTKSLDTTLQMGNVLNGPPFASNSFERILLDAPCSALGNRPVLKNLMSPTTLASFPIIQKKLFSNAVGLLKVGGVLVYSTCTVTEAENENIVLWAKINFPEIKLVKAEPIYGGLAVNNSKLTEEERMFLQRFGPKSYNRDQTVDSIGYFIAKFIKISS